MGIFPQLIIVAFVAFLIFIPRRRLGGSFYWFMFSRHQWSLLEFWVTTIVGTLPLAFLARNPLYGQDIIKDFAIVLLLVSLIFAFTGAAVGLMIANRLNVKHAMKRLLCLVVGWAIISGGLVLAYIHESSKAGVQP